MKNLLVSLIAVRLIGATALAGPVPDETPGSNEFERAVQDFLRNREIVIEIKTHNRNVLDASSTILFKQAPSPKDPSDNAPPPVSKICWLM